MKERDFIVLPKVLGLIVEARTGEVAGVIDGSGMLPAEVIRALAEAFGEVVSDAMMEEDWEDPTDELEDSSEAVEMDRDLLEKVFRLPARDVECEREGDLGP